MTHYLDTRTVCLWSREHGVTCCAHNIAELGKEEWQDFYRTKGLWVSDLDRVFSSLASYQKLNFETPVQNSFHYFLGFFQWLPWWARHSLRHTPHANLHHNTVAVKTVRVSKVLATTFIVTVPPYITFSVLKANLDEKITRTGDSSAAIWNLCNCSGICSRQHTLSKFSLSI